MKLWRNIVIVVSILLGCAFVIFVNLDSPTQIAAFSGNTPTEENYKELENIAMDFAHGKKIKLNKNIKLKKQLNEDTLVIYSNAELYGVTATFPITDVDWKIENGSIYNESIIDYSHVTFERFTAINPVAGYILINLSTGCLIASFGYLLFYDVPKTYWDRRHSSDSIYL